MAGNFSRFCRLGAEGFIKIVKVENWLGFKTLTLTLIIQWDAMEVGENQIELKLLI